jgi:hypothetical protein
MVGVGVPVADLQDSMTLRYLVEALSLVKVLLVKETATQSRPVKVEEVEVLLKQVVQMGRERVAMVLLHQSPDPQ